jgi:hypothetical protein
MWTKTAVVSMTWIIREFKTNVIQDYDLKTQLIETITHDKMATSHKNV